MSKISRKQIAEIGARYFKVDLWSQDYEFAEEVAELAVSLQPVQQPAAVVGQEPVATVIGRAGDDLRIGWLRPENCKVGSLLYTAPVPVTCAYCAVAVDGAPVPAAGAAYVAKLERLKSLVAELLEPNINAATCDNFPTDWAITGLENMLAERKAAGVQGDDDLPSRYIAAIDSVYPIPDTPHNSVMQRAMDDRIAFRKGLEFASSQRQPDSGRDAALPVGVYWNQENHNFYHTNTGAGMGNDFYMEWRDCFKMFPDRDTARRALAAHPAPSSDAALFWYVAMPDGSHDGGTPYFTEEEAQDYVDKRAIPGCSVRPLFAAHPANGAQVIARKGLTGLMMKDGGDREFTVDSQNQMYAALMEIHGPAIKVVGDVREIIGGIEQKSEG